MDNLIVRCEEYGDKKKLAIVSIDSDECFGDEFIKTARHQLHDISIRYAIWLLPNAFPTDQRPLKMNKHASNKLLSRTAEYFAVKLLVHLYEQNQKMNALYDEGVITKDELLGSTKLIIILF